MKVQIARDSGREMSIERLGWEMGSVRFRVVVGRETLVGGFNMQDDGINVAIRKDFNFDAEKHDIFFER